MSNFGSYVKALRKASTHLTEEPSFLLYNIVKNVTKTILFTNKTLLLQDIRELNFIKGKKYVIEEIKPITTIDAKYLGPRHGLAAYLERA